MSPLLIKEVTRRVNLVGIFQAIYTTAGVYPSPLTSAVYYHRLINIPLLLKAGFAQVDPGKTQRDMELAARLPDVHPIPSFTRAKGDAHMCGAYKLVMEYLAAGSKLHIGYGYKEFVHWVQPRKGVVSSFVTLDDEGEVNGFISYYFLETLVKNCGRDESKVKGAYLMYMAPQHVNIRELVTCALIEAKKEGADVVNCLNIMDNEEFIEDLRFGLGDGNLQYYVYNWKTSVMTPSSVGAVIV